MRYADELVGSAELDMTALPSEPAAARELKMAQALIATLAEPWEPERFEDRHRDTVMALIRQKAAGGDVALPAPVAERETPDLLAALQASLERSGKQPAAKRKPRSSKPGTGPATSKPAPRKRAAS
jgi:DNA end-binding protein Ku